MIVWLFLIEKPGDEPDEKITASMYLRWEDDHLVASDGWFDYPKKQRQRIIDSLYVMKFEYLK